MCFYAGVKEEYLQLYIQEICETSFMHTKYSASECLSSKKRERRLIPVFWTGGAITLFIYTYPVFMGVLLMLEVKRIKCLMTMCKHG